ncbi:MAG: hypothetical protein ACOYXT_00080 [Bacteroidota bacterium]
MKNRIFPFLLALVIGSGCASTRQPSVDKALFFIDGRRATKKIVDRLDKDAVESISVLKGESATALYGKKGKRGVVLIVTKKLSPR